MASSVLQGIKVVEVAQVAAVPMAGRHLVDFSADVIHIEPPVTGDAWRQQQPGQEPALFFTQVSRVSGIG